MSYAGELSGKRRYSALVWTSHEREGAQRVPVVWIDRASAPPLEPEPRRRRVSSEVATHQFRMAKEVVDPGRGELGAVRRDANGEHQDANGTNNGTSNGSSSATDGARPGLRQLDDIDTARKTLDPNRYATKKTIAQGMLDVALLTANASQLRYVLQVGEEHEFYTLMVTLICLSIVLQCLQAITNMMLTRMDVRDTTPSRVRAREYLNHLTMALAMFTVFSDAIRSGFGYDAKPTMQAMADP